MMSRFVLVSTKFLFMFTSTSSSRLKIFHLSPMDSGHIIFRCCLKFCPVQKSRHFGVKSYDLHCVRLCLRLSVSTFRTLSLWKLIIITWRRKMRSSLSQSGESITRMQQIDGGLCDVGGGWIVPADLLGKWLLKEAGCCGGGRHLDKWHQVLRWWRH